MNTKHPDNPSLFAQINASYRLWGWSVALLGFGLWAYAAFQAYQRWIWEEPGSGTDLFVLVFCIAAGALFIRGAQDVYRNKKSQLLDFAERAPETPDLKPFKSGLDAKLILTVTDQHGFTADPLIHVHEILRDKEAFWLVGELNLGGKKRKPIAVSTLKLTKIKDVETNVVVHEGFRTWISQRLDGWSDD